MLNRRASTTSLSMRSLAPSIRCSRSSATLFPNDVLPDGALIGLGHQIQGEHMQLVPISMPALDQPAETLQVQRRLGTGSYAVVYLVREVLSTTLHANQRGSTSNPPNSFLNYSDNSDESISAPIASVKPTLGREFAVKCLSKSALDAEGLEAQMQEARIQQSLPTHPNVVTLYRTLETASYLLLIMEYVPGSDLFYFLEQARDHEELLPSSAGLNGTPPTPSLLASLHPSQILSTRRLRLIANMFGQMCDAVAHCHLAGVAHRDVKPENFMVTETEVDGERHVVVKLTDFGLATRDTESCDMDCGSAPYMSFECHNNLTPTYATAPADVWSLGIVLINMLYHANPWLTTSSSQCSSFDHFLREPIDFFMDRFPGMAHAVATFFSHRVFCLLDQAHHPYSPTSPPTQRVTASEFGQWTKDSLVTLLGPESRRNSIPSHPRPRSPPHPQQMSISQPALRSRTPSPVLVAEPETETQDGEVRSGSSNSKRRKRAPRGHGSRATSIVGASISIDGQDRLSHLADASQKLAREASSLKGSKNPAPPTSPVNAPIQVFSTSAGPQLRGKKSAKWAGIFTRRDSGSDQDSVDPEPTPAPTLSRNGLHKSTPNLTPRKSTPNLSIHEFEDQVTISPSSTAENITSLLRVLDPVVPASPPSPTVDPTIALANAFNPFSKSPSSSSRGRKKDKTGSKDRSETVRPRQNDMLGVYVGRRVLVTMDSSKNPSAASRARSMSPTHMGVVHGTVEVPPVPKVPDLYRPSASRIAASSAHLSLVAPSIRSNASWRTSSSASSIGGSSTYTAFSNASVSTMNTSVSGGSAGSSWRRREKLPGNIKPMSGIPWELGDLPPQHFPRPDAPGTSAKRRQAQDLEPISEDKRPSSSKDRPPSSKDRPSSGKVKDRPASSKDKDRPPKSPAFPRSPTFSVFEQQQQSGFKHSQGAAGLAIDSGLANSEIAVDLAGAAGKPKTPTKSRLWGWRK